MTFEELVRQLQELQERVAKASELMAKHDAVVDAQRHLDDGDDTLVGWARDGVSVPIHPGVAAVALKAERNLIRDELGKLGVDAPPDLEGGRIEVVDTLPFDQRKE